MGEVSDTTTHIRDSLVLVCVVFTTTFVSHLVLLAGLCGQTVDLRSPVSSGFIERGRGVNCRDFNRTRCALDCVI